MEAVILRRLAALAVALLAAASSATACQGDPASEDIYDEYTICPEHYPADAPRFEDYPAKPYSGPVAAPRWRGDGRAGMYRTRLKYAAENARPNFAGHFIFAHWGCGAGCLMSKIIDARTGKVFHPDGVEILANYNVHASFWDTGGLLRYRPDSRLFILIGAPNEDGTRRGISFFVWTGARMKLLRHVHVPGGF
jgi:hypothetical protein